VQRDRTLRYAQSGHQRRQIDVDVVRAKRVRSPTAKKTLLLLSAALLAPVALSVAVAQLPPAPGQAPVPTLASHAAPKRTPLAFDGPVRVASSRWLAAAQQQAPSAVAGTTLPMPILATSGTLQKDEALSSALARMGVNSDERSALVRALVPHLETRSLRPGAVFSLRKDVTGALERFEIKALSGNGVPRDVVAVRTVAPIMEERPEPSFAVTHHDAPIEVELASISGSVRSSLYQAMVEGGEDPVLVDKFVDVFAWNVDFYRQTQRSDTFKVLVEKRRAGGRFLGYGRVLAAEYNNAGTVHRGVLFESKDGQHTGTYDEEGSALMRTFLKSPMEMARITSSYGMRFHPVLGRNKAHEGVDYGAAIGTPVWSVADGVVQEARYSATAGNMIVLKHINGFTTEYFHLSRFSDDVRVGQRLKQKQIIGYVGNTGMSTGPHLHFGMLKSGSHVDPQKQKFPNARPVPGDYAKEFDAFVSPLLAELKALDSASS
jgi:murein DD-endopeptidase MepM/ murein hydrolase activator NlpD